MPPVANQPSTSLERASASRSRCASAPGTAVRPAGLNGRAGPCPEREPGWGRWRLALCIAPLAVAARGARLCPRVRHRRPRCRRRPRRRLPTRVAGCLASAGRLQPGTGRAVSARAFGDRLRAAGRAARPARSACRPALPRRRRASAAACPHQAPRPCRDRAPLRPVERLLRADPRRAHGVLVRHFTPPRRARRWPRRSAPSSTSCAGSSGSSRPACACSTSGAAGDRSRSTRPSTGAPGSPVSRSHSSSSSSCRSGSPTVACTTRSRCACRTTATSATVPTTSPRRSRWASTSAPPTTRASSQVSTGNCGRAVVSSCNRCRGRLSRWWPVHRGVHRTGHAHAPGARDGRVARRRGSTCWTSKTSASTTCAPPTSGAPTSELATGRDRRARGRRGRACVAALHRRWRAGVRRGSDGRRADPGGKPTADGCVAPSGLVSGHFRPARSSTGSRSPRSRSSC